MRVVAKSTLRNFWKKYPETEEQLKEWHKTVKAALWNSPSDLVNQFSNVRLIANDRAIFNIKGNHFRLVVFIKYNTQTVYIRFLGTHTDYDKINAEEI